MNTEYQVTDNKTVGGFTNRMTKHLQKMRILWMKVKTITFFPTKGIRDKHILTWSEDVYEIASRHSAIQENVSLYTYIWQFTT